MPHAVEHIVRTHQAAKAFRAAGKPAWRETVRVDLTDETLTVTQTAAMLASAIRTSAWFTASRQQNGPQQPTHRLSDHRAPGDGSGDLPPKKLRPVLRVTCTVALAGHLPHLRVRQPGVRRRHRRLPAFSTRSVHVRSPPRYRAAG